MGIKDVLLLLEPHERGRVAAQFAVDLTRRMQAKLTAVGVVLDPAPPASLIGDYPYEAITEIMRRTKADLETRYQSMVTSGVGAELRIIQDAPGDARARFAHMARCHDLTVMRQPDRDSPADDGLNIEAALFGSGRAVLLIPYVHDGNAKLDKALVAWDGGLPAARALAEALPLLRRAERVEIVTVQDAEASGASPCTDVVRHLALHGVEAVGRILPGGRDVGAILLSRAADFGADYLVMGAYGHSRMREIILGGATRAILKGMTIPVLMAH